MRWLASHATAVRRARAFIKPMTTGRFAMVNLFALNYYFCAAQSLAPVIIEDFLPFRAVMSSAGRCGAS